MAAVLRKEKEITHKANRIMSISTLNLKITVIILTKLKGFYELWHQCQVSRNQDDLGFMDWKGGKILLGLVKVKGIYKHKSSRRFPYLYVVLDFRYFHDC